MFGHGFGSKGGTRGGRDQFNWEDVKADKHRESYLGNSVKAAVGRWQNGRDILWYDKAKPKDQVASTSKAEREAEKQEVKRREEILMQEALGLRPKTRNANEVPIGKHKLEKHEMETLLRRGMTAGDRDEKFGSGERIKGIGTSGSSHQQAAERAVHEGEGVEAGPPVEGAADHRDGGRDRGERRRRHRHHRSGDGGRRDETADGDRAEGEGRRHRSHKRRRRHRHDGRRRSRSRSRSRSRERHDSD